jgi:DNA-binding HxlR family transcriptional regulator
MIFRAMLIKQAYKESGAVPTGSPKRASNSRCRDWYLMASTRAACRDGPARRLSWLGSWGSTAPGGKSRLRRVTKAGDGYLRPLLVLGAKANKPRPEEPKSVKPQSMGATLAELEQEDLVERHPHPTDGRQVLFALTAAGVAARRKRSAAKQKWLIAAMAKLDRAERRTLLSAVALIKRLSEGDS